MRRRPAHAGQGDASPSAHSASSPRLLVVEIGKLDARAEALGAPTVARVVREQARIERFEAAAARRARALGREELAVGRPCPPSGTTKGRRQHTHHVAAELDGARERVGKLAPRGGLNVELSDGQLDVVHLEPVEPRPGVRRRQLAVDAQRRVAAVRRPLGELGVVALAGDHERREQGDALAAIALHDLGVNGVEALRVDRHAAVGAVLNAELDEQQAQKMIDLGQRRDGALAAAAARALLDRHGRRNAVHGVDVSAPRRLDELARIGIQRLEVPPLPLRKQNVERHRALPAAAHARDHRQLVPRDREIDVPQVVLTRTADLDDALGSDRRRRRRCRACCNSLSRDTPEDHPWGSSAHIPVRRRSRERLLQHTRQRFSVIASTARFGDRISRSGALVRATAFYGRRQVCVRGFSRDRRRTGTCADEPQGRSSGVSRESPLTHACLRPRHAQRARLFVFSERQRCVTDAGRANLAREGLRRRGCRPRRRLRGRGR